MERKLILAVSVGAVLSVAGRRTLFHHFRRLKEHAQQCKRACAACQA